MSTITRARNGAVMAVAVALALSACSSGGSGGSTDQAGGAHRGGRQRHRRDQGLGAPGRGR